ncbi:hypothetical protein ScPMuIL_002201 [Solemya velum]
MKHLIVFVIQVALTVGQLIPANNVQDCAVFGKKWMKPQPTDDSFFLTPYCYLLSGKEKDGHSARDRCAGKTKIDASGVVQRARLVEINSADENEWIWDKMSNSKGQRYIGMQYDDTTMGFGWDSGNPVSFANWGIGQPDNHTDERCVVINKKDGKWNDIPCEKPQKFVCQILALAPDAHKPSYYYLSPERATWDDAKQDCISKGGYLAELESQEEHGFVEGFISASSITANGFWIGARRDPTNRSIFRWSHSEYAISFENWYDPTNEPSDSGNNEDCVQIFYPRFDTHEWNDAACSTVMNYICERKTKPFI